MISFNIPPFVGDEFTYLKEAIDNQQISGDGLFTKRCTQWLKNNSASQKVLLTTSCTHALEMAALLLDIAPGDEIIMPAYTFVSTADAFVMRGATIVFVDIRPDTMNIDENLIAAAITKKTRAIVPVHYAGVSCAMDEIMAIAEAHRLAVVEDAAQGLMASYQGRALGTIGDFGCFSFHETKNYSMGEGGALLIRDEDHNQRAEIIREKGTNRSAFFRGEIDKYTWVATGSSYLPSDLNAAYLWPQLLAAQTINANRLEAWQYYYEQLRGLADREDIRLPVIPADCRHNAHMFYLKTRDLATRTALINHLREREIQAIFHYIPLHTSPEGKRVGRFCGEDRFTTSESERILRLPLYYGLKREDQDTVLQAIEDFFRKQGSID